MSVFQLCFFFFFTKNRKWILVISISTVHNPKHWLAKNYICPFAFLPETPLIVVSIYSFIVLYLSDIINHILREEYNHKCSDKIMFTISRDLFRHTMLLHTFCALSQSLNHSLKSSSRGNRQESKLDIEPSTLWCPPLLPVPPTPSTSHSHLRPVTDSPHVALRVVLTVLRLPGLGGEDTLLSRVSAPHGPVPHAFATLDWALEDNITGLNRVGSGYGLRHVYNSFYHIILLRYM